MPRGIALGATAWVAANALRDAGLRLRFLSAFTWFGCALSVLSVVADDRKLLTKGVGAGDRARLDQYFTSVRELEQTLEVELHRPEIAAQVEIPAAPEDMPMNKAVPNLLKVTPIMAKLVAIGLATDQTRIFNMALSEPASTIGRNTVTALSST